MSKQEGIKHARDIISRCVRMYGRDRVERALARQVRISDLENYLKNRYKMKQG